MFWREMTHKVLSHALYRKFEQKMGEQPRDATAAKPELRSRAFTVQQRCVIDFEFRPENVRLLYAKSVFFRMVMIVCF